MALNTPLKPRANELAHSDRIQEWGSNFWIHAYYANGDMATRKERTMLVKRLNEIVAPSYLDIFQKEREGFLRRAALFCLSDYVEDILSDEDMETRRLTARRLLECLFENLYTHDDAFPFPTSGIISSILKRVDLPPKSGTTDGTIGTSTTWLSTSLSVATNWKSGKIRVLETSRYLDRLLSAYEIFLKADIDPLPSLSFVPKNFVFRKDILRHRVEERLDPAGEDLFYLPVIFGELEGVMREEIEFQKSSVEQYSRKRKNEPASDEAIFASSEIDSRHVTSWEKREASGSKRMRIGE
ncbi:hypothetical protein EG329_002558 [Mollisiaceae sp. DMI_Dod_QoI]|nr:hypothetical protein EG329_002558 [Helotiales sp. DMI_Dod_QoI]